MNLWQIDENSFDPTKLHAQETVYTIGNGYFGTRGTFEEGYPGDEPATLLAGVFDAISVGREELANAPDWLTIKLFVDGERFRLDRGTILSYHRELDLRHAVLRRTIRWESPTGKRVKVVVERFASLADAHIGLIRYSVTAEGSVYSTPPGTEADLNTLHIALRAGLNLAVGNYDLMHWTTVDQKHEGNISWLHTQTRHSLVQLVQTMSFIPITEGFSSLMIDSDIAPNIRLEGDLPIGKTLTAEKLVLMYTSFDETDPRKTVLQKHQALLERLEYHNHTSVTSSFARQEPSTGLYDDLYAQHKEAWQQFWDISDVVIEGDNLAQIGIRYSIYQLAINAPWHDDTHRYSIAAKGLTGFGYRGHVFHDTEIFMLPFFTYVHPDIARKLLLYRYRLLPSARAKATRYGYEGAQFPWESTHDGREATPESIIHPESGELIPVLNGHIELHITASIALATWHYWFVTGDDEFMRDYGAEILLSTAHFWASRVEYHSDKNDYEYSNVIGPDEWHEMVNNDAYTNYMARWNIITAIHTLEWLWKNAPEKAQTLSDQLGLTNEHLELWQDIIARLYIPQDKLTGPFEQFDGFFKLEPLDQNVYKSRTASYQALLGMEPVQRLQIIKQADVLMLLTVLSQEFDVKTKSANWNYYYPITDHDYGSSLTPALHTILACELGLTETAYHLFMKGAFVDIEDLRRNTGEGIHLASAGTVWQGVILGFAGLRVTNEGYITNPKWPDGWKRLVFNFFHKGKQVHLDLHRPSSAFQR